MKPSFVTVDGKEIPPSMVRETMDGPVLDFHAIKVSIQIIEGDALSVPEAILTVSLMKDGAMVDIAQSKAMRSGDEYTLTGAYGVVNLPR